MKKINHYTLLGSLFPLFIFLVTPINLFSQQPAFPTGEGGGRFTSGGRGGAVYEVTTLLDNNSPGSLRYAVNQSGARTIVFKVSGTIYLGSTLEIKNGNITIAGQSAPGDGICIAGYPTVIKTDNVIVRYLRFRLGDLNSTAEDSFWGRNQKNIIIDHCSMTWSVDECASFYDNENFTLQWCIIGESLFHSVHPKGEHGYGGIQGGMKATFHHNLYINNTSRNPRFCGARYHIPTASTEVVDFVNNVIYNWGFESIYGGELGQQNIRNNYFKPGPATISSMRDCIFHPTVSADPAAGYGTFYIADNYVEGFPEVTADNWGKGIHGVADTTAARIKSEIPFAVNDISMQTAQEAFDAVLNDAGANRPKRDAVDTRLLQEARTGISNFEGNYYKQVFSVPDPSKKTGIIDSQTNAGGWPQLNTVSPPADSDHDGMPDYWETANGLNPSDASDRNNVQSSGYTNLEVYLNGLADGSVVSAAENKRLPVGFQIEQNYPNPFNPSTIIKFYTGERGFVAVNIFDIQGKLVNTLFKGEKQAGESELVWNGKDSLGNFCSSGVYLCNIVFNSQQKSLKMMLLK